MSETLDVRLTWADGTPLPPRPGHVALPPATGEVVEGEARDLSALPPAETDAEQ